VLIKVDVSEVECELSNSTISWCNFTYACHIFHLNNMFLQETNTFYCVTLYFSTENCECSKLPAPYWCKGAPGPEYLLTKYRVY
jgi:hypothetical protein